MKKILLLGPSLFAVSGVSTHLSQLFASSLAKEYNLVHFQVGSEGRRENILQKTKRFFMSPFSLAVKIIATRPDIIHLNTSLEQKSFWRDAVYLVVAKFFGKLTIYQVHGGKLPQHFFDGNAILTAFLRWLLSRPDAIILLASAECKAYQSFSKIKRLLVIPNAIDLESYSIRSAKQLSPRKIKLGYIGRLAHDKGIFEAIEALGILRKSGFKNVVLSIAGSGPAEGDLRAKVKTLGLDTSVTFTGPIFGENKLSFWRQMDIFIFPTFHREGLPYTVLESLASGTPMIIVPEGGISDVIKEGVHGIFVPPHDPGAVAAAVQTMVLDRERTQKMSFECIARAQEFYGINRMVHQFSELYKDLLS